MTVNSTKKICVFLSAILVCSSSFGMDGESTALSTIKNTITSTFSGINNGINGMIPVPSKLVISGTTVKLSVATTLLPAVAVGAAAILKQQPVSEDHRALIGAVIALPTLTYLFTRNLTTTQQFKRHCDARDKMRETHPIINDKEALTKLLKEDTEESCRQLERLLLSNYSLKIGDNRCPRVVLQQEVTRLGKAIETELRRMQEIVNQKDGVNTADIDEKYSDDIKFPSRTVKRLETEQKLISDLSARILMLPQYECDADRSVTIDELNVEKQAAFGWAKMLKPLLGSAAISVIFLALLKALGDKFDLSIDWTGLQQMLRPISVSLDKAILIHPVDLTQQ